MMYWGNGMGGWGMAFMIVGTLIFWGLVVAGIVFLLRRNSGDVRTTSTQDDPHTILAGRYARGAIDDEEYHRRSGVLRGGSSIESQT
jgi:putative membrane protein